MQIKHLFALLFSLQVKQVGWQIPLLRHALGGIVSAANPNPVGQVRHLLLV